MKSSDWLLDLKLSVINGDKNKILALSESIPESFESKLELDEALALTQEALTLMAERKAELGHELAKLKKVRKYI